MRKMPLMAAVACVLTLSATSAAVASSAFEASPKSWRLQEYTTEIIVFFTPSTCAQGKIIMPSTWSAEARNRFWSVILSAKMTDRIIGIFYDPATCNVISYYLKEE